MKSVFIQYEPLNAEATSQQYYTRSRALFERAVKVIPGGIYGHASPALSLAGRSPYYAVAGEGCRYRDVDGREYIDFMCGYGPLILGCRHPEVEAAAAAQNQRGDCFNHPTERSIELAERLVETVDGADWAVFGKNGGDMTSWAIRVAREHTRRKKILRVRGAYHGIDAWCSPGNGGLITEDRMHVHDFCWNDPDMLANLFKLHSEQVAALVLTPFHHPNFGDCALPEPEFVAAVNRLCKANGVVLIMDDVRAGFRLDLRGSHCQFGFVPDIICFSKALANGYALSAACGANRLKLAAGRVFLTGSFWNSAVAMAAALATLEILSREAVPQRLRLLGERLRRGMVTLGQAHDLPIIASGPPAIPFFRFAHEHNFMDWQRYCAAAMAEGVFFHPHHNWFLCAAHDENTIDEALAAANRAMVRFKAESCLATVPAI